MRKNILTVAAFLATAFFVATGIAQAADFSFGGEVTHRWETNGQGGTAAAAAGNNFDDDGDNDEYVLSRYRLHSNINVTADTSAFIQLQSTRVWGESTGATVGTSSANPAGEGNSSFTVNDNDSTVGVHQAYFVVKNFANLPVSVKAGKQEFILDGHRLFGNTIWTAGMQSHDMIRLDHSNNNYGITYAYIIAQEDGASTGNNIDDRNDQEVHVVYGQYRGILGGNLSLTFAYVQDGCGNVTGAACTHLPDDIYNIGFRQAGKLYGINYRAEYYHQWGSANATASTLTDSGLGNTNQTRNPINQPDVDRDAYMFGVRVGKTFANVTMQPSLTIMYDYLSGTSDEDLTGSDASYNSFNTLFDTGHKFYGLADVFLGVGSGSQTSGTSGLGLQDAAIKAQFNPMPDWTFRAHYHWFWTAESPQANPATGICNTTLQERNTGGCNSALGNELDLALTHHYNPNMNVAFGFSNYTTTASFRDMRNVVGDAANWGYVQMMLKF